jgi:hypothetical protein
MAIDVHVVGPPRPAARAVVGYPWALPLSEAPLGPWIALFDGSWSDQPGLTRPPRVDAPNKEILLSIDLGDERLAAEALDRVATLVEETTRRINEQNADALAQALGHTPEPAEAAEAGRFFDRWWQERGGS